MWHPLSILLGFFAGLLTSVLWPKLSKTSSAYRHKLPPPDPVAQRWDEKWKPFQ